MDPSAGASRAAMKRKKKKGKDAPLVPLSRGGGAKKKKEAAAKDAAAKEAPPPAPMDEADEAALKPAKRDLDGKADGAQARKKKPAAAAPDAADDGPAPPSAAEADADADADAEFVVVVDALSRRKATGDGLVAAVGKAAQRESPLDSDSKARKVFAALMAPVGPGEFYRDVYERKGLHIKNRGADFLQGWLTSAEVLAPEILKQLKYGVDLDVTRFDGRKRLSVRPRGAADGAAADDAAFVRKAFEDSGATVRLRCPQQRFAAVHSLCAALEDEFGSTVGANAYLTPASGQGFAPHWDDVDVFVLQLEGSKRWRVYAPPSAEARLPRRSSSDFAGAGALKAAGYGAPHDVLLERGDVLYLPRGFVHEAAATEDASLHLTLSAHRDNSWADLLEEAVPLALARAIDARPEMRRSLPRDYLHYAGLQHAMDDDGEDEDEDEAAAGSDDDDDGDDDDILSGVQAVDYDATLHRALAKQRKRRRAFAVAVRRELFEVLDLAASPEILDEAADEMAKRFIAERLPPPPAAAAPPLKPKKKGAKAVLTDEARVYCCGRRVARLCVEEGGERAVLYHSLANATTHRGAPVAALEFDVDDAPSIEALLASHPARPVRLCDLPHAEKEDRLGVAEALFEAGLLVVVKNPDDEDE